MNEERLFEIAYVIYDVVDGADHKQQKSATVQAIFEWLVNGDDVSHRTIDDLAAEWHEYNAE